MKPTLCSIRVNNDVTASGFAEIAGAAEDSGFDQIWVSNDLMRHSALALVPAALAATSRIQVGIGVLNPYTIHPSEIAMYYRSLADLAEGRLLLGIGAGAADFLSWVGVSRRRPLATTERAIIELRHLFGDSTATPSGWDGGAPGLVGRGGPPIYVGAMSPKMLQLAGRLGDGVLPLLFPPERYEEARDHVLAGSDGRNIDIAACVWCSVSEDASSAAAALASRIAYYGPSFSPEVLDGIGLKGSDLMPARRAFIEGRRDEARALVPRSALSLGLHGDAAEIVERCQRLIEMGAGHISFGPPLGPEPRAAIRILGSKVVPALSG